MEFQKLLKERHSVRAFTDEQIDVEKLIELMKICEQVPSWCNTQNWKVYIATGQTLEAIRKDHVLAEMNQVPSHPVWEAPSRSSFFGKNHDNMYKFFDTVNRTVANDEKAFGKAAKGMFNAQAIAFLAVPKNSTAWTFYDLGAMGATLMLTAKDLGIDTIPAYELVKYPSRLEKFMDVDPNYEIVMGIALGYEDKNASINTVRTERQPLDSFLEIYK